MAEPIPSLSAQTPRGGGESFERDPGMGDARHSDETANATIYSDATRRIVATGDIVLDTLFRRAAELQAQCDAERAEAERHRQKAREADDRADRIDASANRLLDAARAHAPNYGGHDGIARQPR